MEINLHEVLLEFLDTVVVGRISAAMVVRQKRTCQRFPKEFDAVTQFDFFIEDFRRTGLYLGSERLEIFVGLLGE